MSARLFFFYILPLTAYAVFIVVFSVLPVPPIMPEIWNIDKLEHMGAYAFMAALLLRLLLEKQYVTVRRAAVVAFFAAAAFGAAIEVVQSFTPTRFGDVYDALANAIGAFSGAYVYAAVYTKICGRAV